VDAIREKNAPVCVGLDPLIERFPPSLLQDVGLALGADGALGPGADPITCAEALRAFGRDVIRVVAPHVPAVKINIAFFERYHVEGLRAYLDLVRCAREVGLLVFGDIKRADIGHSSTQYARAHLLDDPGAEVTAPDAITVNPYFGFDTIRPFVDLARDEGRGLFVLVQTSNESAAEVQNLALPDGLTLGEHVAGLVQTWARAGGLVGRSGYSCIGAVVSPRDLPSTERIRALMPQCVFLVPGFGAQGRTAQEVAKCFRPDGTGAIVNASRSVIYAHNIEPYGAQFGSDWPRAVEAACRDLVTAIRDVVPS
jgi:orotidine-5'-phosphate decarboxylase